MKRYIARPGQKVTIEINRKPTTRRKPQIANPKGLLSSRLPEDYQARRLKKTLRIFDGGRLPSGEDITDFAIQPTIPAGLETLSAPEPELAWYAARDEFLFALDGATLFDKFYEITRDDGELYRLEFASDAGEEVLTSDNPLWTNKGVKFPRDIASGDNFSIRLNEGSFPVFRDYRYNFFQYETPFSGEDVKITQIYDYDGGEPVTDFRLKAGDALFLMPNLCFYLASAKWFDPNYKLAHLGYDFRFGLRNYYAEDLTPDADPTRWTSSPTYADRYQAVQEHINKPSARVLRGDYDAGIDDIVWYLTTPENFIPNPPWTPTSPPDLYEFFRFDITRAETPIIGQAPVGALLAIVIRGANTFYLWRD